MRRRPLLREGEWPTLAAIAGCYVLWLAATAFADQIGLVWLPLAAVAVAFHSSLQHEALHGHPTRSAALNEALVFPPLMLLYPYRRFREQHLRHHNDSRLTDPYDDPESWYLAERDAGRLGAPMRWALHVNGTLLGRMLLGPWLGAWGFWRADWRAMRAGDPGVPAAWALHGAGVAMVLGWVVLAGGQNPLVYFLFAALPGAALISVRTYVEHRAAADAEHRSAIIEAGPFWSLLFLNNNLHAVHHAEPGLAWHRIPARYRAARDEVLARNGGYVERGYLAVFRAWLLRRREPLIHPFMRRG